MKNKLITLLKAIGIVLLFCAIALLIGALTRWSDYLRLFVVLAAVVFGICHFYRMMRPKKRYYFVSYSHGGVFCCCTLISDDGIFMIKDTSKGIREEQFGGVGVVVILYYKELSKEEYYAQTKGGKQ